MGWGKRIQSKLIKLILEKISSDADWSG